MKYYQTKMLPIACLLVISFLTFGCSNGEDKQAVSSRPETEGITSKVEPNSAVQDYISFIGKDENKMTLDHGYTNTALLRLNDAIESFSTQIGFDVKGDLMMSRRYADMITKNPYETTHADNIRKSADILATILQNIQMAKFPDLSNDAATVKSAAAAINPDILTLEQKDKVKAFFTKTSDLLSKMN